MDDPLRLQRAPSTSRHVFLCGLQGPATGIAWGRASKSGVHGREMASSGRSVW